MTLPAQDYLFCTDDDVRVLLSLVGVNARLDDNRSGLVEESEAVRLTRARNYATARVKFYCVIHYEAADLARSWLVNDWTTVIAAYWLCACRLGSIPDGLRELYEGKDGKGGVMKDLADIRARVAQIPDIGYRNVDWPAWSNLHNDPRYRVRQLRVQRTISEPTPTQYTQSPDWPAESIRET